MGNGLNVNLLNLTYFVFRRSYLKTTYEKYDISKFGHSHYKQNITVQCVTEHKFDF